MKNDYGNYSGRVLIGHEFQKLYVSFFGRPADNEGLTYWGSLSSNAGFASSTLADSFV